MRQRWSASSRFLVVDDSAFSRRLLIDLLTPLGGVETAGDGLEAVQLVEKALKDGKPYDVVCLDVDMPQMDGLTACKEIRRIEADCGIPIGKGSRTIVLTSSPNSRSFFTAFREGCDAFLPKPFRAETLFRQLRSFGIGA